MHANDYSSGATNISSSTNHQNTTSSLLPLCFQDEMGRGFNKLIEIAKVMSNRSSPSQPIGLNDKFTSWYYDFLEPPSSDDELTIIPNYKGECERNYQAGKVFSRGGFEGGRPEYKLLLPRREYRRQAEDFLEELKNHSSLDDAEDVTVVTVHARRMEHKCIWRATWLRPYCLTAEEHFRRTVTMERIQQDYCKIDYSVIERDFAERGWDPKINKTIVLLSTDSQNQTLDSTFPIIVTLPFPAATWLMVLSDVHYGNPLSTVDFGVAQWRYHFRGEKNNDMRPRACWVVE